MSELKQQSSPRLTIDDMIAIAKKLSKERGRYVSYGEVQTMIETGKLDVHGKEWKETK